MLNFTYAKNKSSGIILVPGDFLCIFLTFIIFDAVFILY